MTDSKLIIAIKSLDQKEKTAFRKFLQSPYFNRRQDVVDLFEFLVRCLKKGQSLPVKTKVFQALFPQQEYHDQNFHLVVSYLLKLLEKFLFIEAFLKDKIAQSAYLIDSYKKKSMPGHLKYAINQSKKQLDKQPLRDSRYFEQLRDLSWQEYQLEEIEKPSGNLSIENLTRWTDIAYLSKKLRQICLLTAHKSVYTVGYKNAQAIIQTIFPYLEKENFLSVPAIGIYYHGYYVLQDVPGSIHFEQFKQLLFEHTTQFGPTEIRELYLLAINFCVKQVNKGDKTYFSEMLSLYQKGLELGVLLDNGIISRFTYHNAIAAALQIKAFEWAKTFIHQYRGYLEETHQESAFHFNLARLAYEQGQYDDALSLIHKTNFQDILLNLAAKTISLKIYFKLEAFDLLDAHLNAMNNFIRRNRVLGYHRKNYLNIIKYTKRLLSLNQYDKTAIEQLIKAVQKEDVLTEKKWFLAQLG